MKLVGSGQGLIHHLVVSVSMPFSLSTSLLLLGMMLAARMLCLCGVAGTMYVQHIVHLLLCVLLCPAPHDISNSAITL